jgi:hypothetical protein
MLGDEVELCIDLMTASDKWQREISVYLNAASNLPRRVNGDLKLFKICLQTIIEFGLIYNPDD